MPLKTMVMVKRKPGLSAEEFRDGLENVHSRIAVKLFGHLWLEYRRNYLQSGRTFVGGTGGPDEIQFDAITEFVVRDASAIEEAGRIYAANVDLITQDEANWFDREKCWIVTVDTVEEDLSKPAPG